MQLVKISNPQTGAEVLENFRSIRSKMWDRKGVPDHGIVMRNGWPVRPPRVVIKTKPPETAASIIAKLKALVDQVTPDIPAPQPEPPAQERRIMVEDIQRAVARHYNVSRIDILGSRRTANVVRPRQIAMYLCKTLTLRSLPDIGRRFGGRDHTTALHAVRKITGLVEQDEGLAREIAAIRSELFGDAE